MAKKQSFSNRARDILGGAENKPKSMREFLADTPEEVVNNSDTSAQLHKSANEPSSLEPQETQPTDRLHCFIPRSLKLRVEAYVLERKRDRKKGEKIDITSVVIEALMEKLERDGA